MRWILRCSPIVALTYLAGCASIVSGASQTFTVDTNPEGAACRVTRGGIVIADIPNTPGAFQVSRGSNGLDIACTKPGFAVGQIAQPTNLNGWLVGNVAIGGLLGLIIDFSTGAAYRYSNGTLVTLTPASAAPGAVAYSMPSSPRYSAWQRMTDTGTVADPLVIPPSTPNGDVTYRWGSRSSN
jgi:hypothetical protein